MTTRQKFCVVGPGYPFRGGIAKYTTALCLELQNQDLLQRFFTPSQQYPAWLFPGKSDVERESCPQLEKAESAFDYFNPFTWPSLLKKVAIFENSCLVLPFWSSASLPLNRYLLRRHQGPSIAIVHNWKDHERRFPWLSFKKNLFRCNGMIYHHQSVSSELGEFPFPEAAYYNPLPPIPWESPLLSQSAARTTLNIPRRNRVFLFWGLIRPYKGLENLLTAFEKLSPHFPATLLVAGEPWGRSLKIRNQLERLQNSHSCRFSLDWVSEREMPVWFSAADVVVTPYLSGSGSAVVSQARHFRKPLIATPCAVDSLSSPACEIVEPGNIRQLHGALVKFFEESFWIQKQKEAQLFPESSWTSYAESLQKCFIGIQRRKS